MNQKKIITIIASMALLAGCTSGTAASAVPSSTPVPPKPAEPAFEQKTSDDRHITYVKKYTGLNAANCGYTSLGGDRLDQLGSAHVKLVFVTEDGSYLGVTKDEDGSGITDDLLKDYVVTAQNFEPNTEVHIEFDKDSEGKEYDNLTIWQSIDEIDLAVRKVGSEGNGPQLTPGQISPDRHTYYIRDYVGKNLGSVGYYSLGGDYLDAYSNVHVKLVINTEDGSYVDPEDSAQLQQYAVTGQSVPAGTELSVEFDTDSEGNEYSNLTSSQSVDSITLNVTKIAE